MKQHLAVLGFETPGRGLIEITETLRQWMRETDIRVGLLTLHCQHTSASILINENAADAVQSDLLDWLDRIAPESKCYAHDSEGPDDMPAHLKTALTGVNLSLPVADGRMMLGTWQGIFLAEHRAQPHKRSVAVHLIGE